MPSLSHSASNDSRYRNSASHSRRQSARKRRGTITPMTRISQSQKRKRVVCVISAVAGGAFKFSSALIVLYAIQRRGGFSPPLRINHRLGRGKPAPTLLLQLTFKGHQHTGRT